MHPQLDLTADQLLSTTRSVRKRLDTSRRVPRELIEECLTLAFQAPNGSNMNAWRWIVVDDPALVRAVAALEPLRAVDALGRFDAYITVRGGGKSGQIDAIKLGIARALVQYNPDYRAKLKPLGFLTRDARVVERKKYGKHKARRAPQYSKR